MTADRRVAPPRTLNRARSAQAKERVREALIEAGRELFAKGGDTVSLRMIAKHAHYSAGIVYKYFPDRESLFLAIRESELEHYVEQLEQDIASISDAEARLRHIAGRGLEFAIRQANLFGLNALAIRWIRREPPGTEALTLDRSPASARIHAVYEDAIIAVMRQSGVDVRPDDISVEVAGFLAVISGPVLLPQGSTYKDFPTQQAIVDRLVDLLLADWKRGKARRRSQKPIR